MHTPGPWTVDDSYYATFHNENPGRTETVFEIVNRDEGVTPCYATNLDDARLIAKAPDLKAALAWALDQIEDDLDPDHQAALAHARSLLED